MGKRRDKHTEHSRTGVRIAPGPHPVSRKALGTKGQVRETKGKQRRDRKRQRGRQRMDLEPKAESKVC